MAQPSWSEVNGWEGDDESNDSDRIDDLSDAPSEKIPIQSASQQRSRTRQRPKPVVKESEDESEEDCLIPKWQREPTKKKQERGPLRELLNQQPDPLVQGLSDVKGLLEKAIRKIDADEQSIQKLET